MRVVKMVVGLEVHSDSQTVALKASHSAEWMVVYLEWNSVELTDAHLAEKKVV